MIFLYSEVGYMTYVLTSDLVHGPLNYEIATMLIRLNSFQLSALILDISGWRRFAWSWSRL